MIVSNLEIGLRGMSEEFSKDTRISWMDYGKAKNLSSPSLTIDFHGLS